LSQQHSCSSSLLEGYDEPEILRSSSRQFCLTSAEAGHLKVSNFYQIPVHYYEQSRDG
jgi:hypothetical protein